MTNFANDIVGTLNLVNQETNLTKEVGIFVRQVPDFKVLARDAESLKKLLRKVCTGETDPHDAAGKISHATIELRILSEALKDIK